MSSIKDIRMNLSEVSKALLDAKRRKNLTFTDIGQKLGRDEVWVAALFYGQASVLDEEECKKLLDILQVDLSSEQMYELTHPPFKGSINTSTI